MIKRFKQYPATEDYTERHHVLPVAIFGETEDTVVVSYKHHIILHYLLYRGFSITGAASSSTSAAFAVRRMLGNGLNAYNGSLASAKDMAIAYKAHSLVKWRAEVRNQISATMKLRWDDPVYRLKMTDSHRGKKQSDSTIAARKAAIELFTEEKRQAIAAKASAKIRQKWQNLSPEQRKARIDKAAKSRVDRSTSTETREKLRRRVAELWRDPEYRARQMASRRKKK